MASWRNLRLQTRITLILFLVLLIFFGLGSYWQYAQLRQLVLDEAIDKARIIATEANRTRDYLAEQLEAGGVSLNADRYGLIPVVAANRIGQRVAEDLAYTIRHTSNRYRNPQNAPDAYERQALQQLSAAPAQQERYATVSEQGLPVFRYLRAAIADQSCLPCHSEPERAPAFIRDIFPPEQDRAYHYRVGEVIGAVSISIPMTQLEKQLQARLQSALVINGGIFLALVVCLGLLTRQTVLQPLSQLAGTIGRISRTGQFDERLPVRSRDEIGQLITSFNAMLDQLAEKTAHLEESEQRFRLLTELARDAIVAFLPNGQIFLFNRQAERVFGYSQSELLGEPLQRLLADDESPFGDDPAAFLERVDETWLAELHRVTGRRRDGSTIVLEMSLARVETGARHFFTAIMRELPGES